MLQSCHAPTPAPHPGKIIEYVDWNFVDQSMKAAESSLGREMTIINSIVDKDKETKDLWSEERQQKNPTGGVGIWNQFTPALASESMHDIMPIPPHSVLAETFKVCWWNTENIVGYNLCRARGFRSGVASPRNVLLTSGDILSLLWRRHPLFPNACLSHLRPNACV